MSQIDTLPDRGKPRRSQEWKLLPLLALPLACCALPAIVASLAAVGAAALTIGLGAATVIATLLTVALIARRRSKHGWIPDDPQPTPHREP